MHTTSFSYTNAVLRVTVLAMQNLASQAENRAMGLCRRYRQLDPTRAATSNGAPPLPKLSVADQTASNEQWDAAMHVGTHSFDYTACQRVDNQHI